MKKVVYGLLFSIIVLSGCGGQDEHSGEVEKSNLSSTSTMSSSKNEKVELSVYRPQHYLKNNNFDLSGQADPQNKITVTKDGKLIKEIEPTATGSFNMTEPLPETEDTTYEVSDGTDTQTVTVKSKVTLEKEEAEAEITRKQRQKEKEEADKKAAEEVAAKEQAEKEAAAKQKKEAEEAARKAAEEEKASYDTGITYENLARNPDTYIAKKVKFSGKIIQVLKGEDHSQFRFAIDDNYDQILFIEISEDQLSNNRLLEDDYITIRGISYGEYTYTSALGGEITIPGVVVDSFELN
ncbi:cell envelope integrity protein TolA [Enterococcus thailandicus]|uniref:TcdA-E operon negative regulator n=1 Tax=Enterococcus thailandicus TaxID=417368 RepID=A0A179EP18_ENTTH|nr:cell envelope integrity protein TolA [Enterococcus thailandicus]MDT2752782.1 cell envelope integrity protein TolA [Enterococcus thailandicus]MDT2777381.1 cell envelope integrity protein TolA [Enterococcus thailandicus]MDT2794189.1 cell envelope integrity protein TolA [Enterococcus thailandicus]OAQ54998.1 hypothetical protein A6E74_10375 [Enterococcus thailandicus]